MAITALIPARGGSKRIPRKNILPFCGKPLIQWTIEAAQACPSINRVIVSTDDHEIASFSKDIGAEIPFIRPQSLSEDSSNTIDVVIHALENLIEVTDLLLLQPTSPFRSTQDISRIISIREENQKKSAVSLVKISYETKWLHTLNDDLSIQSIISGNQKTIPINKIYSLNGALYLATRDFLFKERSFVTHETIGYIMPEFRSVDIDNPIDWSWGEFLHQTQLV